VDRPGQFVRLGNDDGARFDRRLAPLPALPQPREREKRSLPKADVIRLLGFRAGTRGPFVIAVGGNQAAPAAERAPEGRLGGHGFGPGVDGAEFRLGLLGPGRDQPPAREHQLALAFGILPDDRHVLAGRDVVAGNQSRDIFQVELAANVNFVRLERVASAHACFLLRLWLAGGECRFL